MAGFQSHFQGEVSSSSTLLMQSTEFLAAGLTEWISDPRPIIFLFRGRYTPSSQTPESSHIQSLPVAHYVLGRPLHFKGASGPPSLLIFMRVQISAFILLLVFAFAQDPYCLQSSGAGGCSQCIPFFYLKNGVCTQVSPSCLTYDNLTGACLSCLPGSTLTAGSCVGTGGSTATTYTYSSSSGAGNSSTGASPQFGAGTSQIPTIALPPLQLQGLSQSTGTMAPSTSTTTTTYYYSSNGSSSSQNGSSAGSSAGSGGALGAGGGFIGLSQQGSSGLSSTGPTPNLYGGSSTSGLSGTFSSSGLSGSSYQGASGQSTSQNTSYQASTIGSSGQSSLGAVGNLPLNIQPSLPSGGGQTTTTITQVNSTTIQTGSGASPSLTMTPQVIPPQAGANQFGQSSQQTSQFNQSQQSPQSSQGFDAQFGQQNGGFQGGYQQGGQSGFGSQQAVTTTTVISGQQQQFRDPNCNQFVPGSNRCIRCATRYYINNQSGLCTAISGQCSSYNQVTGACEGCYPGFLFMNGECYVQVSATASGDPNCKVPAGNTCQTCYQGYFVSNGVCVAANPLCASIDYYGNCLSCYAGYALSQGNCVITGSAGAPPNCANFTNGRCVRCAQGSFFSNGNCVSVSPLCRTYDNNTGVCTSCYDGYDLRGPTCVVSPPSSVAQNCRNFTNGVCVQCSQGFLMIGGVCRQSNPLCQTVDRNTGLCTSCYGGYALNGFGQCIIAPPDSAASNCKNWTNGRCYECSKRFYMSGGQCLSVNDYCNDYNPNTGACTSCYQGFVLQQGACYKTVVTLTPQSGSSSFSQTNQLSQLAAAAQQQAQQSQQAQAVAQQQAIQQAAQIAQQAQQQLGSSQGYDQGFNAGSSSQGLDQSQMGAGGYYQQTTTYTQGGSDQSAQAAAQAAALAAQQAGAQQGGFFLYSQSSNNTSASLPSSSSSSGSSSGSSSSSSSSSQSSSSSSGTGTYFVPTNTPPCLQQSPSGACLQCNSPFRLINGQCQLIV